MPKIRIEDEVEDVLKKAARGQGLSVESLVSKTGFSVEDVSSALDGDLESPAIGAISGMLGISVERLSKLAVAVEGPGVVLPDGAIMDNTAFPVPGYEEMTVNSYVLCSGVEDLGWIAFDTGANADALVARLAGGESSLHSVFLTHTHRDHVEAFEELSKVAGATFTPELEPYANASPVRDGDRFTIGVWEIEARLTSGHSAGGTTYVVRSGEQTLAIVGDAIFCFSMGKADSAYESALQQIREKILSLPEDTIICPGHGPLTTVGFEKENNPFFA